MNYVLDRFGDSGFAVLESPGGGTFPVPRSWLPVDAAEGDVLTIEILPEGERGGGAAGNAIRLEIRVDSVATEERRERARTIRDRLPRAGGGDITL